MEIRAKVRTIIIGFCLLMTGLLFDGEFHTGMVVSEAEARVGRPATPGSVAGVARRMTRRTIRRTTRYVNTLPGGCPKVNIDGTVLWHCGGTYYQAHGSQYVVVQVN